VDFTTGRFEKQRDFCCDEFLAGTAPYAESCSTTSSCWESDTCRVWSKSTCATTTWTVRTWRSTETHRFHALWRCQAAGESSRSLALVRSIIGTRALREPVRRVFRHHRCAQLRTFSYSVTAAIWTTMEPSGQPERLLVLLASAFDPVRRARIRSKGTYLTKAS